MDFYAGRISSSFEGKQWPSTLRRTENGKGPKSGKKCVTKCIYEAVVDIILLEKTIF